MAKDYNSAELCLNAVQALEEQLRGARKTLINSETCVVNRGIMTAQLEYLKDNLPESVKLAAKIVAEDENIRNKTEQDRCDTGSQLPDRTCEPAGCSLRRSCKGRGAAHHPGCRKESSGAGRRRKHCPQGTC